MDSGVPAAPRGPGLETGKVWILQPRPGPHPHKAIGKEKSKARPPPSSCGIQEDEQNSLNGSKWAEGFFLFFASLLFFLFFFPQVRQWDVELWKSHRQIQKRSTRWTPKLRNWNKFHFAKPENWLLLFICIIIIFHYLYFFYFISIFIIFFPFSFLHFISLHCLTGCTSSLLHIVF